MIALAILLAYATALRFLIEILEVHDSLDHQYLIRILYMDYARVENFVNELLDIKSELMNARGRMVQLQGSRLKMPTWSWIT